MSGLGIRDVVVGLHEHPRTYSKAPMEFWEPGKRRPCFVNDPVGTECRGPKIIFQDAPMEFVMTRNLLLRSATLFQLSPKFQFLTLGPRQFHVISTVRTVLGVILLGVYCGPFHEIIVPIVVYLPDQHCFNRF